MKNTQRVKKQLVHMGGGRRSQGLPADVVAQLAYWQAYIEFLDTMSEDPRFFMVDKELELWDDA